MTCPRLKVSPFTQLTEVQSGLLTLLQPDAWLINAHQVIISDVDVMWLRDPVPFFKRYPDADVLTSADHLLSTVGSREELEKYPEAGSAFNIGEHSRYCCYWHHPISSGP
eukprot:GHUV01032092.1.p2 GENE.GHUV01032092.1~~GHUV01032092.1.p2  ORF type:complete len:110 (-),score=33.07 GHUV01032092.1:933-1262(-)